MTRFCRWTPTKFGASKEVPFQVLAPRGRKSVQNSENNSRGYILAVRILAANSDLNFAADFGVNFFLLFFPWKKKEAPQKIAKQIPQKIHLEICSDKFPSHFCRSFLQVFSLSKSCTKKSVFFTARLCCIRESFCESREGVRLPRERGWPPGKSGNFRGSLGNFRGGLGNFRGTSGLLLSSTVRELPGKWPKNFRGSPRNFRGSPGTSQKLGGAWLPPSDSPNLSLTAGVATLTMCGPSVNLQIVQHNMS